METFDIVIIGGGILGTAMAYTASAIGLSVCLIEGESDVALHSSSRNTGVIHRPFYLNPNSKKAFATAAGKSYAPLKELCKKYDLPWKENGTVEVAVRERDLDVIKRYSVWAKLNGMSNEEFEVLSQDELLRLETNVRGYGAFYSKKDTNVDFHSITKALATAAQKLGATFLFNTRATSIANGTVQVHHNMSKGRVAGKFVVNAAGGESLALARTDGVADEYGQLHFRGDYYTAELTQMYRSNIYTVPRHTKFPFLDPHIVKKPDGTTEIGPNAFLVRGPYSYNGTITALLSNVLGSGDGNWVNRYKLFLNTEFVSLVASDWLVSISKRYMVNKVREFAPLVNHRHLNGRGISGIRHNLLDKNGFVPEAIFIETESGFHVLNYNSPGATGSPWFATAIVKYIVNKGIIKAQKPLNAPFWEELIESDDGWKMLNVVTQF